MLSGPKNTSVVAGFASAVSLTLLTVVHAAVAAAAPSVAIAAFPAKLRANEWPDFSGTGLEAVLLESRVGTAATALTGAPTVVLVDVPVGGDAPKPRSDLTVDVNDVDPSEPVDGVGFGVGAESKGSENSPGTKKRGCGGKMLLLPLP